MNDFHEVQSPEDKATVRRLSITAQGNVQGVFFRRAVAEWATTLGISGFVTNRKDGSVYIEAEGEPEDLDNFVQWCRQGPPLAEVSDVKTKSIQPQLQPGFVVY